MKGYCAITEQGMEELALCELGEIAGAKGTTGERTVFFETSDAFKACYLTQSVKRIIERPVAVEFKDFEDLLSRLGELIDDEVLKAWVADEQSFRVACEREGDHDFASQMLEQELGSLVFEKAKQAFGIELNVDLKSPSLQLFADVYHGKAVVGIDLVGRDLSKRAYRIFSSPGIVNAKLAYAMVRLAGYDGKQKLVDVNCKSGIIPIEAALYASRLSASRYQRDFLFTRLKRYSRDWDAYFKAIDSKASIGPKNILGIDPLLRNVEASKKNAKLAGVDKIISFSKIDVDWLDTKLDEGSVDLVVSRVPSPSGSFPEKAAVKYYKELLYHAEFFLKRGARMHLLSESMHAIKPLLGEKFKIAGERRLWSGKQPYDLLTLEKL